MRKRGRETERQQFPVWALWQIAFSKDGCTHSPAIRALPLRVGTCIPSFLNLGRGLRPFQPIDNSADIIMWLPRLGHKEDKAPVPWEPRLGSMRELNLAQVEGPRRGAEVAGLTSSIYDHHCERPSLWTSEIWNGPAPQPWNLTPLRLCSRTQSSCCILFSHDSQNPRA